MGASPAPRRRRPPAQGDTSGTSSQPSSGTTPTATTTGPATPDASGTDSGSGGGPGAGQPAAPPIDAVAAKRLTGEQCRAQLAVLSPPTATLIESTNLTARVIGRIEELAGSPRLGDLAGITGQNYVVGRGLLSVEADGTLRGRWATLQMDKITLTETGSVREDVVLGSGFADVRAIGGNLRGQGEPYPAIAILRTSGTLQLYPAEPNMKGPLAFVDKPRTIATGLTSATAVTAFGAGSTDAGVRTVPVLVADARGLTEYVVDVDHPNASPQTRRLITALPGGIVGLGRGYCATGDPHELRGTDDAITVAYDAARRGHVYLSTWTQGSGQGPLRYVGAFSLPVSGGTLAP